jgi:hypothetical protein
VISSAPSAVQVLHADLSQLWCSLDELMQGVEVGDADFAPPLTSCGVPAAIPGHVAWFDHGVVLHAIGRGESVPRSEQCTINTVEQLEGWGAPAPLTSRRSPQAARAWVTDVRAAVRQVLDGAASEADLERPIWWPLPLSGGWQTVRFGLEACSSHTWNHVAELWALMHGPHAPMPDSLGSATHRALARYARQVTSLLNRDRLARAYRLTAVMVFTGPGGGAWTFRVVDGECRVTEEYAHAADVVITQSPATFARTFLFGTDSQLRAVLAGDIRIRGSARAALMFRRLFRLPPPGTRTHVP